MSAKMKSTKRSPRIKPCKARGVDSKGTARMSKHPLDEIAKVEGGASGPGGLYRPAARRRLRVLQGALG